MWALAVFCALGVVGLLLTTLLFVALRQYWTTSGVGRRQTHVSLDDGSGDPLHRRSTALIVIAHPDDECMFFGPTLMKLAAPPTSDDPVRRVVYLLCLSSGNFHGLGKIRKQELQDSCRKLGLDLGNVLIISHSRLPDNSAVRWNKRLVAKIVLRHVEMWDVDTLVTFGRRGVSGHDNHRAIYRAVRHLYSTKQLPAKCRGYSLDDVNILRKYLGFLDVPLTYLFSKYVFVSTPLEVSTTKEAMGAHVSQMVWFRRLYCAVSRYMIVNSLKPLLDVEWGDFDDSDDNVEFLR